MTTYMADITLPEMTEKFLLLVPEQRALVDKLMSAGTVASVALSLDRLQLWMVIVAQTERDVRDLISTFPIAPYISYTLSELAFHEQPQLNITHFSLN